MIEWITIANRFDFFLGLEFFKRNKSSSTHTLVKDCVINLCFMADGLIQTIEVVHILSRWLPYTRDPVLIHIFCMVNRVPQRTTNVKRRHGDILDTTNTASETSTTNTTNTTKRSRLSQNSVSVPSVVTVVAAGSHAPIADNITSMRTVGDVVRRIQQDVPRLARTPFRLFRETDVKFANRLEETDEIYTGVTTLVLVVIPPKWDFCKGAILYAKTFGVFFQCVSCHPHKDIVAMCGDDGASVVHEPGELECKSRQRVTTYPCVHVAWSPDGTQLAVMSNGSNLTIWRFNASGQLIYRTKRTCTACMDDYGSLKWNAGSTMVSVCDPSRRLDIFDLNVRGLNLATNLDLITQIVWHPTNSKLFITNSMVYGTRLFEVHNNDVRVMASLEDAIDMYHMQWHPDGDYIVGIEFGWTCVTFQKISQNVAGTVVHGLHFVQRLEYRDPETLRRYEFGSCALHPSGLYLATLTHEGLVHIWPFEPGVQMVNPLACIKTSPFNLPTWHAPGDPDCHNPIKHFIISDARIPRRSADEVQTSSAYDIQWDFSGERILVSHNEEGVVVIFGSES